MNSEASDKENGAGKKERRWEVVYALDSQVPNKLSKSKNWYVVSVCSLPALHIRASTTRCTIAAPVLHTGTIRKSIGHPTTVTVFSWVNQVVSTKVVSCHKARTIIIWVWKHK